MFGTRAFPITALAVVGLTLGLTGCGSSDDSAASSEGGAKTVSIKLVDAGCDPVRIETAAGATTFEITNTGAASVTEFEVLKNGSIIGEKENLTPGLSGKFSLNLMPGEYDTLCLHGTTQEKGKLIVTGAADNKPLTPELQKAVDDYRAYAREQAAQLVSLTSKFVDSVKAGNVAAAKSQYAAARAPFERIEPVAESFGDLDPEIDAREGDVDAKDWGGFHKIEQALWVNNTTKDMGPVADELLDHVKILQANIETIQLQPAQIANGANELLNEVSKSKITGEEEQYSRTDLYDFAANVDGSKAAFTALKPALASDSSLVTEIEGHFSAVDQALAQYKSGTGYVTYDKLSQDDTKKLAQTIDTLAESLSKVPAKIASAS